MGHCRNVLLHTVHIHVHVYVYTHETTCMYIYYNNVQYYNTWHNVHACTCTCTCMYIYYNNVHCYNTWHNVHACTCTCMLRYMYILSHTSTCTFVHSILSLLRCVWKLPCHAINIKLFSEEMVSSILLSHQRKREGRD